MTPGDATILLRPEELALPPGVSVRVSPRGVVRVWPAFEFAAA